MNHPSLSPTSQRLALLPVSTPPAGAVFLHQANVLLRTGLSTREEIDSVASVVPSSGPFIFIPGRRALTFEKVAGVLLSGIASSYRAGMASRVDLKHPVRDIETPDEPYFITGYDETPQSHKVSAAERAMMFMANQRSPLTALELSYRLLYSPGVLGEAQFAAAGSAIERGEEDSHVPVFFLSGGNEGNTLILGSFLREHRSKHTNFPSCRERVRVPRHLQ